MPKENKFVSLRIKLLMILAVAIVISVLVFLLIKEVGDFLVWRYYLDENTKQEREESYIEKFQQYVKHNKLSIDDNKKISSWSEGRYINMVFYKDSKLIYAPEWFKDYESESETEGIINGNSWFTGDRSFEEYLTEEARAAYREALDDILSGNKSLKPVHFVDGTLLVTVADYSEDLMYGIIFALSLIISFLVLAIIMVFGFTNVALRVKRLALSVKYVEQGNLDHRIFLEGNDELSSLASDVNNMRNSVVDNMSKERQAWEANVGLITAMSHDIRTPLTVLLGYLELIDMQNEDPDSAEYIKVCRENALRLKRLSDEMFSYFLVFGRKDVVLNMEIQTSKSVENMIAEHVFLLSEKRYSVEQSENQFDDASINIDAVYFGRVIDNIFSNIEKYADHTEPITITTDINDDEMVICVSNKIANGDNNAESNGIGLKTCERIMERMGGSFEALESDGFFNVTVKIPLYNGDISLLGNDETVD